MAHEKPAAVAPQASPPAASSAVEPRPRNRIQVSREKRPLYFFIGLAKKFLLSEDEVELSGLGLAVTTVVTVAEILKNSGHVTISKIATSLVDMQNDGRNTMPKAKIQIWIRKSAEFDHLVTYVDNTKKQVVAPGRANASTTSAGAAASDNLPTTDKPAQDTAHSAKPAKEKPVSSPPASAPPKTTLPATALSAGSAAQGN